MQIELYQYEVMEAIQDYLVKEYSIDTCLGESSEPPCITAVEIDYPIKKHKNGKPMKDEHGFSIRDFENPKWNESHINFSEDSKMSIYLEPGVDNDR